ncbi:60S ribosomal protein L7a-1, variant 3 [Trebouxia sp. C0009 RCD-2024]
MAPKGKRVAAAPAAVRKTKADAKPVNPLYEKRNKHFGVGGAPPPKKDLHRLVKWPRYVRIQRQRRVLGQRLKVPPALTRFTKTLDKSTAATLFKLLLKYRPEARKEKKERLLKEAESREAGQKGKARLGTVVHKKTATALALTGVKGEDNREFAKLVESAKSSFNDGPRMNWSGGIMGPKSQAKAKKREKERNRELAQRV